MLFTKGNPEKELADEAKWLREGEMAMLQTLRDKARHLVTLAPAPAELDTLLTSYHSRADELLHATERVPASDLGALVLEIAADPLPPGPLRHRLYSESHKRAVWWASCATAGGEGIMRMQMVHRLNRKLKRG